MIWDLEGGASLFLGMTGTSHTTEVVILGWYSLCNVLEVVCPSHLRISGVQRLLEGGRPFSLQKAALLWGGGVGAAITLQEHWAESQA